MARKNEEVVLLVVGGSTGFVSAQEVYSHARESGSPIGLATVYRVLKSLVDAGKVELTFDDQGQARYCARGETHHHHATCRQCGRTIEFDDPDVERWAGAYAERIGFVEVRHVIEISGVCHTCASSH
ncbi:MAG: transcriptional repressor [Acidimicrobiaceae bacterium]|nr:transcriptional repressor [Acidimicrobiaceae bacterium]